MSFGNRIVTQTINFVAVFVAASYLPNSVVDSTASVDSITFVD